jgi:hypothetical protein
MKIYLHPKTGRKTFIVALSITVKNGSSLNVLHLMHE